MTMTHRYGLMTALTCALLMVALTATAQTTEAPKAKPKVDARAETALKKTGYKYSVTELGNFRISFALDDNRSQLVVVSSTTQKFGEMETRRIGSTVMLTKEMPSADVLAKLLMDNVPQKSGAFELTKTDNGYKVTYAAKIDANAPPAVLKETLRIVMLSADNKEKELTGKDEY